MSIFVPSSGGQWVIQGFITRQDGGRRGRDRAARPPCAERRRPRGQPPLALLGGDAAGIARVDFRQFIGYNVLYAVLWFVIGVTIVTLVPPG